MAIGTPFLLQPCSNMCWHLFSSVTLHAVITASDPGSPAETLTPAAGRLQQSPGVQLAQLLNICYSGNGQLFWRPWHPGMGTAKGDVAGLGDLLQHCESLPLVMWSQGDWARRLCWHCAGDQGTCWGVSIPSLLTHHTLG